MALTTKINEMKEMLARAGEQAILLESGKASSGALCRKELQSIKCVAHSLRGDIVAYSKKTLETNQRARLESKEKRDKKKVVVVPMETLVKTTPVETETQVEPVKKTKKVKKEPITTK